MKKDDNMLLMESVVFLAVELYQKLYDADIEGVSDDAHTCAAEVIGLARKFERELDWKEDDERDYYEEVDKFVEKVRRERLPTPLEIVTDKLKEFRETHGHDPLYAETDIMWKSDEDIEHSYIIKLDSEIDERTDEQIFFNTECADDILKLTSEGNHDFIITNVEDLVFFDEL